MTINKAEVYRKAAEIIVRDGKTRKALVEGHGRDETDEKLRELLKTSADESGAGAGGRRPWGSASARMPVRRR
ncbi:hypothetical protein [Streptomyces sp. R44]|uniref:Uncharacterized protein n=1 Tax=Streptomyces sp. R44 TaxID=3238633 RepID=A0AB39TFJ1_9ACTN